MLPSAKATRSCWLLWLEIPGTEFASAAAVARVPPLVAGSCCAIISFSLNSLSDGIRLKLVTWLCYVIRFDFVSISLHDKLTIEVYLVDLAKTEYIHNFIGK